MERIGADTLHFSCQYGKKKLMEFFKDFFRYKDNSVCPVNYDDATSVLRRSVVAGIALMRDKRE